MVHEMIRDGDCEGNKIFKAQAVNRNEITNEIYVWKKENILRGVRAWE